MTEQRWAHYAGILLERANLMAPGGSGQAQSTLYDMSEQQSERRVRYQGIGWVGDGQEKMRVALQNRDRCRQMKHTVRLPIP